MAIAERLIYQLSAFHFDNQIIAQAYVNFSANFLKVIFKGNNE